MVKLSSRPELVWMEHLRLPDRLPWQDLAQTMVGTIRYMSPERLAGKGYGVAADVWSLGVVLLEMAARKLPFETNVSQIDLHDRLEASPRLVAKDAAQTFAAGVRRVEFTRGWVSSKMPLGSLDGLRFEGRGETGFYSWSKSNLEMYLCAQRFRSS